jgi:hypothetical protein
MRIKFQLLHHDKITVEKKNGCQVKATLGKLFLLLFMMLVRKKSMLWIHKDTIILV